MFCQCAALVVSAGAQDHKRESEKAVIQRPLYRYKSGMNGLHFLQLDLVFGGHCLEPRLDELGLSF